MSLYLVLGLICAEIEQILKGSQTVMHQYMWTQTDSHIGCTFGLAGLLPTQ